MGRFSVDWVILGSVLSGGSVLGHFWVWFDFLKSLDHSLTRVESIGIGSSNNNSGDEFHTFFLFYENCLLLQY